jgi:nitrate/nitrite-specific signal transduction histidine kinase
VAAISQIASIQRAVLLYPAIVIVALFIGAFFFSRNLILSVTVPVERLMVGATRLASGALEERVTVRSDDEMGQLARAFNSMAEQLETYYGELEERVAERTRALRTSIEVSHRVTTITEREALTREVVEQVRSAFDFYHVHIYLFDEKRENLVMAGGTGEAGRAMLAGGHQLALGQGLVGRTAQKNEVTLVPDTAQDPDWLPNPLLPDTRAEVAVPIAFGGEVLGVLDVQQDEVGSLDEANAELLQSIAAQVAVALQNIRLLEQAQLRAEQAALVNTINQKIQQATTVEDVLRTAAQELGQALGVENARVQLQVADIETNGDGFAS